MPPPRLKQKESETRTCWRENEYLRQVVYSQHPCKNFTGPSTVAMTFNELPFQLITANNLTTSNNGTFWDTVFMCR